VANVILLTSLQELVKILSDAKILHSSYPTSKQEGGWGGAVTGQGDSSQIAALGIVCNASAITGACFLHRIGNII